MKIVIDFYSISDFLSFTVWPLDVAEVTKVCRVNFFKKKIQNLQFLARNTWYTSNESWDYVEFKFTTKNMIWLRKMNKKLIFLVFASKMRPTTFFRRPISRYFIKKNQNWLHQGLEEASTWKVTKGELCISPHLESAGDLLSDGPLCPPWPG